METLRPPGVGPRRDHRARDRVDDRARDSAHHSGRHVAAVLPAQPAHADVACQVVYQKSWDNGGGFGANLTIRNTGTTPIAGWTLTFTFPGDQRIGTAPGSSWSADWRQDGRNVTATSMPWNANLATGASTGIGFNGTYGGQGNTDPTEFALNGVPCNGRPQPQPPVPVITPTTLQVPEGGSAGFFVRLSPSRPPRSSSSSRPAAATRT